MVILDRGIARSLGKVAQVYARKARAKFLTKPRLT